MSFPRQYGQRRTPHLIILYHIWRNYASIKFFSIETSNHIEFFDAVGKIDIDKDVADEERENDEFSGTNKKAVKKND